MSKHTAGPWSFHPHMGCNPSGDGYVTECESFDAHTVYIGAGETLLASVEAYAHKDDTPDTGYQRVTDFDENRANARLIAAAPELLDVLRKLVRLEADGRAERESSIEYWEAARAAIAKAEGTA